jgi:hypothetical protein
VSSSYPADSLQRCKTSVIDLETMLVRQPVGVLDTARVRVDEAVVAELITAGHLAEHCEYSVARTTLHSHRGDGEGERWRERDRSFREKSEFSRKERSFREKNDRFAYRVLIP